MKTKENIYVWLARRTIEEFVLYSGEGKLPEKILPEEDLPEELQKRAGAFVTIRKKGELRGCIGTIQATRANLAEEIISNAVSAASRDPRFPPVRAEELAELDISVDVLEEPEPVNSLSELDPLRYGVIVEKGFRKGLLLPDLEGVDTVEKQLAIALQKAGLDPFTDLNEIWIYRFKVNRYE